MLKTLFIYLLCLLIVASATAAETCSRVAIINFQEVLVDSSTSRKGEGLRYYLEKDSRAEAHLNTYQEKSRPQWYTAGISTVGTGLMIAGLFQSGDSNSSSFSSKKALFIGGASMITLSYLIAKTIEYNNEVHLARAIEEYNRRNLPRIYFSPFKAKMKSSSKSDLGATAGFMQDF